MKSSPTAPLLMTFHAPSRDWKLSVWLEEPASSRPWSARCECGLVLVAATRADAWSIGYDHVSEEHLNAA